MPSFVLVAIMWFTASAPVVATIPGFATMEECQRAGKSILWFQQRNWSCDVMFTCVEQTINPKPERER